MFNHVLGWTTEWKAFANKLLAFQSLFHLLLLSRSEIHFFVHFLSTCTTRIQGVGLIRFYIVKWIAVNLLNLQYKFQYSQAKVRIQSNPCTHSVYSVRFRLTLKWLHWGPCSSYFGIITLTIQVSHVKSWSIWSFRISYGIWELYLLKF